MFKGSIPADSWVEVKFSADHTNAAEALLLVGFGRAGAAAKEAFDAASPGGFAKVRLQVDLAGAPYGMLNIFVDMAANSDRGILEVTAGGQALPGGNSSITGDTRWLYSVK